MKKIISLWVVFVLLLTLGLSGCGKKPLDGTDETIVGNEETDEIDKVDKEQEEGLEEPDLSKKITVEFMFAGWVNLPRPDDDPYQSWINKRFNVEFILKPTSEFQSELLTRLAANDPPDLIKFNSFSEAYSIYEQGVLLEDWNPYLDRMPNVAALFTEEAKKLFTSKEGKLMFLTRGSTIQTRSPKIRIDWLKTLGLSIPKTDEELLEVARKFTYGDPDQNGKDDTYGFTSAGNNKSIGEISNFVMMYGPPDFYINDAGEVSHPILDGNKKRLLDFLRTVVNEKLIDPDWYTVGWEDRKPKLFRGQLGILWYPGVIVSEIEDATGSTGMALHWYDSFDVPKGSDTGGKIGADGIYYLCLTVSKKAAEDKEKMDRIIYILEQLTYPNEDYWKIAYGVGIDNFELEELDNGFFWIKNYHPEKYHFRNFEHHVGVADWGNPIRIGPHQTLYVAEAKDPGNGVLPAVLQRQMDMDLKTVSMPKYKADGQLLILDQQAINDANDVVNEFEIKYILGEEDDYDKFVERWLKAGGQKLIDQAYEQWKALGLID